MHGVLIPRGARFEVVLFERPEEAEVMYDMSPGGCYLVDVLKAPPGATVHSGPLPMEVEVVEAEPVGAVPVGPGVPAQLPSAGPRPAPAPTKCERCRRQLMGGVCSVHGRNIYREG